MRSMIHALLVVSMLVGSWAGTASAVVLYDGSIGPSPDGDTPGDQQWALLAYPLGEAAVESLSGGVTTLDTTTDNGGTATHAGYFTRAVFLPFLDYTHPDMPALDRQTGYEVRFDVRLNSETHDDPNRAGFSAIVLGDDKWGIELGFWTDRIWAQSGPDFLQAESAAYDTTAALVPFTLSVFDDAYSLAAGATEILTGPLRNYSSAGGGANPLTDAYTWENLIFLGDDTSSATAVFDLAYVEVLTGTVTPEPSTAAILLTGGLLLAGAGRRVGQRTASPSVEGRLERR